MQKLYFGFKAKVNLITFTLCSMNFIYQAKLDLDDK